MRLGDNPVIPPNEQVAVKAEVKPERVDKLIDHKIFIQPQTYLSYRFIPAGKTPLISGDENEFGIERRFQQGLLICSRLTIGLLRSKMSHKDQGNSGKEDKHGGKQKSQAGNMRPGISVRYIAITSEKCLSFCFIFVIRHRDTLVNRAMDKPVARVSCMKLKGWFVSV